METNRTDHTNCFPGQPFRILEALGRDSPTREQASKLPWSPRRSAAGPQHLSASGPRLDASSVLPFSGSPRESAAAALTRKDEDGELEIARLIGELEMPRWTAAPAGVLVAV